MYTKTWTGLFRNDGKFELQYNGKSSDILKEAIKLFQSHLQDLEDGIIEE
jgi:hypothetical protein